MKYFFFFTLSFVRSITLAVGPEVTSSPGNGVDASSLASPPAAAISSNAKAAGPEDDEGSASASALVSVVSVSTAFFVASPASVAVEEEAVASPSDSSDQR